MSLRGYTLSMFALIASLALAYATAALGSFFTAPAIDGWYAALVKPELNPPSWVFGPVWSLLYAFMAISAWRVWRLRHKDSCARIALFIYAGHLVLNAFWSVAFFGLQNLSLAFGVILALLSLIAVLIVLFYRVDKLAGILFLPYLAWVSFATYLNLSIMLLN